MAFVVNEVLLLLVRGVWVVGRGHMVVHVHHMGGGVVDGRVGLVVLEALRGMMMVLMMLLLVVVLLLLLRRMMALTLAGVMGCVMVVVVDRRGGYELDLVVVLGRCWIAGL